MGIYPKYQKSNYTCKKCNWTGKGAAAIMGEEVGHSGFDLVCPGCSDDSLDFIEFPLLTDLARSGNKKERMQAHRELAEMAAREALELRHAAQLPDITARHLTFVLRETRLNDILFIVLYEAGVEIWREQGYYEYYWRYLEIGEILVAKYGNRIMDFVVDASSVYLAGDCGFAYSKVYQFRIKLRKNFVLNDPLKN